jgi:cell shape-determining protein MreC
MTAEEKKKIQAWVPISLWIKIDQIGFTSQTEAVTKAFKNLLSDQNRSKIDQTGSNTDQIRSSEIKELSNILNEKDKRLQEIQEHNETLKIELEKAHQDKEAIQNLYDNYMRQMQTLITQKTIEAPGAKRTWWRFW